MKTKQKEYNILGKIIVKKETSVDPGGFVVDDKHVATCEDFISREGWVHFVC